MGHTDSISYCAYATKVKNKISKVHCKINLEIISKLPEMRIISVKQNEYA